MPKLFCNFCGHRWDAAVLDVWVCEECTMASAGYTVIECDRTEFNELMNIISRGKAAFSEYHENVNGSVFPAFVHEATLTEELLDLLILFFDRVVLYIDTFNIGEPKQRIIDKLNAYIENDFITVFSWGNNIYNPISIRKPHIAMNDIVNEPSWNFHEFVERVANIQSAFDTKMVPREQLRRLFNKYKDYWWAGDAFEDSEGHQWHLHTSILNRLNGFSILCDVLGASILTDKMLSNYKKIKYKIEFDVNNKNQEIILHLLDWYYGKLQEFPKFKKADTLIKFRKEVGRESFLNFIINQYQSLRTSDIKSDQIITELTNKIDYHINLAKQISGECYKEKKIILSGLIATLGGIMGGIVGAFIGGIGAMTTPEIAEYYDKQSIGHWSAYFVQ
jgi:hypothetical protein